MKIDITFCGRLVPGQDYGSITIYAGHSVKEAQIGLENFRDNWPIREGEIDIRVNDGGGWYIATEEFLSMCSE